MGKYPKAKMPDYGDGPEPCEDCAIKDKRIAELDARLKESGRIMAQLAEAAEDDGVDGVRWRAIAGDAYDFINAPEGYADD